MFAGAKGKKGEPGEKGKRGLIGFIGYKGEQGNLLYYDVSVRDFIINQSVKIMFCFTHICSTTNR